MKYRETMKYQKFQGDPKHQVQIPKVSMLNDLDLHRLANLSCKVHFVIFSKKRAVQIFGRNFRINQDIKIGNIIDHHQLIPYYTVQWLQWLWFHLFSTYISLLAWESFKSFFTFFFEFWISINLQPLNLSIYLSSVFCLAWKNLSFMKKLIEFGSVVCSKIKKTSSCLISNDIHKD